jgi:hypothetical protein
MWTRGVSGGRGTHLRGRFARHCPPQLLVLIPQLLHVALGLPNLHLQQLLCHKQLARLRRGPLRLPLVHAKRLTSAVRISLAEQMYINRRTRTSSILRRRFFRRGASSSSSSTTNSMPLLLPPTGAGVGGRCCARRLRGGATRAGASSSSLDITINSAPGGTRAALRFLPAGGSGLSRDEAARVMGMVGKKYVRGKRRMGVYAGGWSVRCTQGVRRRWARSAWAVVAVSRTKLHAGDTSSRILARTFSKHCT